MPTLLLLLAPPAWGKTSLLLGLLPRIQQVVVYVSPLKALALEFNHRLQGEGFTTFCVRSRRELQQQHCHLLNYQVVILSYEHVNSSLIQYLKGHPDRFLLVFDEFHLLFLWGHAFRPKLWESFYLLAETGLNALALSATMASCHLQEIQDSFTSCFDQVRVMDWGNGTLLYPPQRIYLMPRPHHIWLHLHRALKCQKRSLVFLPFRRQVREWSRELSSRGYRTLCCVGGEVLQFREQLQTQAQVEVILATKALSHGVNLPPVHRVFIAYPEPERALWLQMVGRGGRDGSPYDLYCLNSYGVNAMRRAIARLRHLFALFCTWQQTP